MIVTKIAFTAAIAMAVTAFVTVAVEEEMRPRNWAKFSRLDKLLLGLTGGAVLAVVVGVLAFIWGL